MTKEGDRELACAGPTVQDAMGESEPFLQFQEQVSNVAAIDRPILIVGERGTGKELAAMRTHFLSGRWQSPLVALNCAALAPSLIESELFGHEAGAFTGAARQRPGRFEMADGGTLFLDEVGLIPMEVQEKILRVVEYQRFERVGGAAPIEVDVRIVAATNTDLPRLAREGRFKEDLLDRLSFEVLFIPPLRERHGDIALLTRHFAARMATELGHDTMPEFSETALEQMQAYPWPGNVRELKNVVERAVYRAGGGHIETLEFDPFACPYAALPSPPCEAEDTGLPPSPPETTPVGYIPGSTSLPAAVREFEIVAIRRAMTLAHHRQTAAARLLGLTYHQFRGLLRKYRKDM